MQCNTNYTASNDNFKYINLNVLKTLQKLYPEMVLGLSDHTPGYTTVLGAVVLGVRVVEKHFTDDNARIGPDHGFSLNHDTWKEMVEQTRYLEESLGDGIKKIEENEKETAILQRRSLTIKDDLKKGSILKKEDLMALRPSPEGSIPPYELDDVIGKKLNTDKIMGDSLYYDDIN